MHSTDHTRKRTSTGLFGALVLSIVGVICVFLMWGAVSIAACVSCDTTWVHGENSVGFRQTTCHFDCDRPATCPPETASEIGNGSDSNVSIDPHEVTNADYKACEDAGVCEPPWEAHSSTRTSYYDNEIYSNYPVIYVTWDQAKAYCGWGGARLPTREEWLRVATGISKDEICIDCKGRGYADTSEIGSNAKDKNLVGIYDLVGNVFEWGEDASLDSDGSPIFGYSDDNECIRLNPKGAADEWIGFRCVRDPVPAR